MKKIKNINHHDLCLAAIKISEQIKKDFPTNKKLYCYPIPRGGIACAYLVGNYLYDKLVFVDDVKIADIIIDDIEDSGQTRERITAKNTTAKFYSLFNAVDFDCWISFPFERGLDNHEYGISTELNRLAEFTGFTVTDIKKRLGINDE
ncbi:MAG: hypothetical protein PHC28_10305 [Flavobacterium sp.]|uniref:hypothetical protein n=1 Tax=Flavobacterium sp. TaxID=239 RepID=UPI00261EFC4C|nr:hypothetical protein [Flavobacterium sp.]MDD5150849.1 hypothetical protein [Flavobacterium sp.]